MITKQKIKHLEKSVGNLRGQQIFVCTKKYHDKEIYKYNGKTYFNLDNIKKDINFNPNDILVIVGCGIADDDY
ncbi:MAG: hypothetical protein WCL13_00550 [bacterium]